VADLPAAVLEELAAVVGPQHVLADEGTTAGYSVDWTGRYRGRAAAVVRPGSTAEVAGVLRACSGAGAAVVPQGGNTGLVGGGVPLAGEVVLSTRRLDQLGPVDPLAAQVTVGAGATLAAVQAHAAASGLGVGVDLAARAGATIGGMVATNAGGLAVVRHGPMRASVAGVEAVLADGSVLSHLGGLEKDNTGYDLTGLLCGSEGTLAVVTAVRLRLVAVPVELTTALVGFADVASAVATLAELRRQGTVLEAAELVLEDALVLAERHLGAPSPVRAPAVLLVEWAPPAPGEEVLAAAGGVLDVAVATDSTRRAGLWRHREAVTEAVSAVGVPHKLDVALAPGQLADFVDEVRTRVEAVAPGSVLALFGHAADGNLHVNVVGPPPDDEAVDDAVLGLVVERGGSISAEHGIGTAKRRWLARNRTPEEVAAMRAVKAALDPAGTLNPNVLFPPG
jgi:FAD/FMN-containing dehydrogenase